MLDYSLTLEAITALATLAVPLVVAVLAHRFNQRLKQWEASQWRNQELVKARLDSYQKLIGPLNDLMCYFTYVGGWNTRTPPEVASSKRTLDRDFFCAAPLFSGEVCKAYERFMEQCFEMWGGFGVNARLRTGWIDRRAVSEKWEPGWESLFAKSSPGLRAPSIGEIRSSYDVLVAALVRDIDLTKAEPG